MKSRWIGVAAVAAIAIAIITYKQKTGVHVAQQPASESPAVLLVVDPSEENEKGGCGEINQAVRQAGQRGIAVRELPPNSPSDLLKRYKIMTAPTLVVLDRFGKVTDRFEGEDRKTVEAIESKLIALRPADHP